MNFGGMCIKYAKCAAIKKYWVLWVLSIHQCKHLISSMKGRNKSIHNIKHMTLSDNVEWGDNIFNNLKATQEEIKR